MSKRGLNIYHRKDGRWEGRYTDGFKSDGKRRYRSVYAKSYGEVKEMLLKIQVSQQTTTSKCNLTVKSLFAEWLSYKSIHVKESTISNYRFKIEKHLLTVFGDLKFRDLSPKLIYDFIHMKQSEGLSAKYISDILIILKSMAKYAAKTHHCLNEIADVELPKVCKKELKPYSKEQQTILKSELLKDVTLPKLGILLCLYTGIRIGELCALKWSDIDLQNSTLHISKTCQRIRCKNGTRVVITSPKSVSSVRDIPLPSFLIGILEEFESSDSDHYFLSETTKIVEPRTMQYRFKAILKKAKLLSTNFHSLRHMFATNCIEIGFDVKTLSEILGHGTVELTLNRYVHSSDNRKRECMNRLELII